MTTKRSGVLLFAGLALAVGWGRPMPAFSQAPWSAPNLFYPNSILMQNGPLGFGPVPILTYPSALAGGVGPVMWPWVFGAAPGPDWLGESAWVPVEESLAYRLWQVPVFALPLRGKERF